MDALRYLNLSKPKYFWYFLLFLTIFLIYFLPAFDPDLGWHLRSGQHLLETGKPYLTNQFSWFLTDYQWPNNYTLYDGLIALVYNKLGLIGLSLLNALLLLGSFIILFKIIRFPLELNILIFSLIAFLSQSVFGLGIRSQLFSFLGIIIVLGFIFTYLRDKKKIVWLLPLIFPLWVNFHGGFTLGLLMIFLFWLAIILSPLIKKILPKNWLIEPIFSRPQSGSAFSGNLKSIIDWGLIGLASGLLSLINPYNWRVYREAWRHFAVIPLNQLILEWTPPPLFTLESISIIFLILLFLTITFKRRSLNLFNFFLVAVFTYLALKQRRDLAFFLLIIGIFILNFWRDNQWIKSRWLSWATKILLIIVFAFAAGSRLPYTLETILSEDAFCLRNPVMNPCQAVKWLKKNPQSDNLYNWYNWGGFLIWQLPENSVFVDGRMPGWPTLGPTQSDGSRTPSGKSPYRIFFEIVATHPGWEEQLNFYQIKWILIPNFRFLDYALQEKDNWQEIYRDDRAVIFRKI